MSRQPISRNAPCPCGSGKKYKQCCLKKSFDWVEDDDGTIRRSVPISDELADEIKLRIEDLRDELGREPQDDDLLFGDEPFERVEHELAMAMRQAGTDPALIYAFEETGMIVSEDNQDLLSDEDLAEWHAAVRRYREQHGIPDEGSAPAVIDGALCWSCGTLIPPQAQRCPRCEAKVEEMPSPQERQAMLEMLEQAEPEMMEAFRELAAQCETGEDFVNMVMIGPCVACGSTTLRSGVAKIAASCFVPIAKHCLKRPTWLISTSAPYGKKWSGNSMIWMMMTPTCHFDFGPQRYQKATARLSQCFVCERMTSKWNRE